MRFIVPDFIYEAFDFRAYCHDTILTALDMVVKAVFLVLSVEKGVFKRG
jgi:hypothetical protein